MLVIFGLVFTTVMVLGSYLLGGGSLEVLGRALPMELGIIGGSGLGSFLMANKGSTIKKVVSDIGRAFKGSRYTKAEYVDALALLYEIIKTIKSKGALVLEQHLDKPEESEIFRAFPRISSDPKLVTLICDTMRVISLSVDNPMHIEELFEKKLKKLEHEFLASSHALQVVADGLPALGIVAAVLGVIKTMSHVDQPPAVLGAMIAGALVGTFLGVFLAYCLVGPLAGKVNAIYEQDMQMYFVIRDVIISFLHMHPPRISIEIGRASIPSEYQPSFVDMEVALQQERQL